MLTTDQIVRLAEGIAEIAMASQKILKIAQELANSGDHELRKLSERLYYPVQHITNANADLSNVCEQQLEITPANGHGALAD